MKQLRQCLAVAPAADACGIDRSTVYRWKAADPAFTVAMDEAIEAGIDDVEAALARRAKDKSDLAAIAILRNRRAKVYNDAQRVEVEHRHRAELLVRPVSSLAEQAAATAGAVAMLVRCGALTLPPQLDPVLQAKRVTEAEPVGSSPSKTGGSTETVPLTE